MNCKQYKIPEATTNISKIKITLTVNNVYNQEGKNQQGGLINKLDNKQKIMKQKIQCENNKKISKVV